MKPTKHIAPLWPEVRPTLRPVPRADHAIVIFGCATDPQGLPLPGLLSRLERALAEFRTDGEALILASGGPVKAAVPEAEAMRDWLVERGVPRERIVTENHSRFTLENAESCAPLIRACGATRVTLVTERFHLLRSLRVLSRALRATGLSRVRLQVAGAPDHFSPELSRSVHAREVICGARDEFQQSLYHRMETRDRHPRRAISSAPPARRAP